MDIFNRRGYLVMYENVQYVNTCFSLSGPAQGPKKLVFLFYKFRILCTDFCEHLDLEL